MLVVTVGVVVHRLAKLCLAPLSGAVDLVFPVQIDLATVGVGEKHLWTHFLTILAGLEAAVIFVSVVDK